MVMLPTNSTPSNAVLLEQSGSNILNASIDATVMAASERDTPIDDQEVCSAVASPEDQTQSPMSYSVQNTASSSRSDGELKYLLLLGH